MTTRNARIVLYGAFGSGNIGNDSSLEAALHHIRRLRPDAELLCVCNGPEEVQQRYGIPAVQIGRTYRPEDEPTGGRVVRLAKKAGARLAREARFWSTTPGMFRPGDLFMVVGTGAVDDMSVRNPWNAPYELYKWCQAARLGGAKVLFVSVGVGPIRNKISRVLMLRALRLAHYRSYREPYAFDYLRSVGYNTAGDRLYPDLVFSLPLELPAAREKAAHPPAVVALGLINYFGWHYDSQNGELIYQDYLAKIKRFAGWLLDQGCTIRLIYGDQIDQRPVFDLLAHVKHNGSPAWQGRVVLGQISNVNELFQQLAQTDLVVASRFHNVLCALMMGLPVISLGYHQKNVDLMKEMGLEAYCQHIEDFTFEKLVEQCEQYAAGDEALIQRIQHQGQHYRQLLDEQYCAILSQPGTPGSLG